jgi:hypothetical protein
MLLHSLRALICLQIAEDVYGEAELDLSEIAEERIDVQLQIKDSGLSKKKYMKKSGFVRVQASAYRPADLSRVRKKKKNSQSNKNEKLASLMKHI